MYQIFEDNAGYYHFAWIENGICTYYFTAHKITGLVQSTVAAVIAGGNPISDYYEGGKENPDECYRSIVACVQERNGGAAELEASEMEATE